MYGCLQRVKIGFFEVKYSAYQPFRLNKFIVLLKENLILHFK